MCQAYRRQYGFNAISLMPTNLYGPGDNFDPVTSHVIPALIRRIHEAKAHGDARVTLWGTGRPRREFMYVDDLARAVLHLMQLYDDEAPINVGTGTDLSIGELARLVCDVVGYDGQLVLDASKPDGTPRKLLDVTRINSLGWRADIGLVEGIRSTYEWCLEHESWERSPDRDLELWSQSPRGDRSHGETAHPGGFSGRDCGGPGPLSRSHSRMECSAAFLMPPFHR